MCHLSSDLVSFKTGKGRSLKSPHHTGTLMQSKKHSTGTESHKSDASSLDHF